MASSTPRTVAHAASGSSVPKAPIVPIVPIAPIAPIVLIGMPGVGKSTVGRLLARRTGRSFLDSDQVIESSTGRRLSQLIATHGSVGFMAIEGRALVDAIAQGQAQPQGSVIATGGSVVYCTSEMQWLRARSVVIHLDAPLPVIAQRAGDLDRRGVLRRAGESLEELFAERSRLYRHYAHVSLSTTEAPSPAIVAEQLAKLLAVLQDAADLPLPGPLSR